MGFIDQAVELLQRWECGFVSMRPRDVYDSVAVLETCSLSYSSLYIIFLAPCQTKWTRLFCITQGASASPCVDHIISPFYPPSHVLRNVLFYATEHMVIQNTLRTLYMCSLPLNRFRASRQFALFHGSDIQQPVFLFLSKQLTTLIMPTSV